MASLENPFKFKCFNLILSFFYHSDMAKVYKAGQVAAALFSKKNSKSNNNSTLTDLFSGTRLPSGGLEVQETSEIVKSFYYLH